VTFSKEAREQFMAFATSVHARWPGNFRDLNAVITRLATLAPGGRITVDQVTAELAHLRAAWTNEPSRAGVPSLVDQIVAPSIAAHLDRFEGVQLNDVLSVCRSSTGLSAVGRALFDRSRERKKIANDADRLRKYLARFDLDWSGLKDRLQGL
jgi:transcriptional regulatory protein RtcR